MRYSRIFYIVLLLFLTSCGAFRSGEPEGELLFRASVEGNGPDVMPENNPLPEAEVTPTPQPTPDVDENTGNGNSTEENEPEETTAEDEPVVYEPLATPPPLVDPPPADVTSTPAPPAHSTTTYIWNLTPREGGIPPTGTHSASFLQPFAAFYRGGEVARVFLTFDLSTEVGTTPDLLDVLNEQNVTAAFFLSLVYINNNVNLVQRMLNEGHIIALRTLGEVLTSASEPDIGGELLQAGRVFSETFGRPLAPFARPFGGAYSERTLYLTRHYGFFTLFWSALYYDWSQAADDIHPGMVLFLPNINAGNIQVLPGIIQAIQGAGFSFGNLYDII